MWKLTPPHWLGWPAAAAWEICSFPGIALFDRSDDFSRRPRGPQSLFWLWRNMIRAA